LARVKSTAFLAAEGAHPKGGGTVVKIGPRGDPIAINVNYFFAFRDDPRPLRNTQVPPPPAPRASHDRVVRTKSAPAP